MQIILASGSPRRRELLSWLGVDFEISVPDIDETMRTGETPADYCSRLSGEKARSVELGHPHALVIAADTVVALRGRLLEKPVDRHDAANHLRLLQGNVHEVYTGYTILHEGRIITRVVLTKVSFRPMNEGEIAWYVSTGEPMDKAGSYGLQGIGSLFIDRVEGSYTNVIGLPLSDLYGDLKACGVNLHSV